MGKYLYPLLEPPARRWARLHEITINSSFGSWANIWTACGVPFKRFLIGVEFDYAFTKFMGVKLHRFDGVASAKEIARKIINDRRNRLITKPEAREAWNAFKDHRDQAESGEHDFGYAMLAIADEITSRHPLYNDFADPCGWTRLTRYDHQAKAFWDQIWPLFLESLESEITAKK
jgi:hypothetical protein